MTLSSPLIAPDLRHRVADHAASGALRDLLEHLRLSYAPEPLSEGAVFGFSGGLDLRVRIAEAAVPTIDVEGRAPSLELELCAHLGIPAQWRTSSDAGTGRELLRAALAAGHPALVRADL
ncbi:MAG TPA: BtrH N-terminal domain-containing protein, partial [Solirubrobacteraceae bacterium]|nr:BtrH N-terminal domain-containing protein [Solirubrobacteraceae bacterium]